MRSVSVKAGTLCLLLIILFTATILACYGTAVPPRIVTSEFFTISLAFQYDPGRAIASFGLPLIGFLGYSILLARILYEPDVKQYDCAYSELRLKWAHRFAMFCPIGFIGVAAVTLEYNVIVHRFFASALFLLEGFAFIILLFEDYRVLYRSWTPLLLVRLGLIITGAIALSCMGLGQLYNLVVTSVGELVFAICAIVYILSFTEELSGYSLQVQLIKTANST
jgi:hypothetical protein